MKRIILSALLCTAIVGTGHAATVHSNLINYSTNQPLNGYELIEGDGAGLPNNTCTQLDSTLLVRGKDNAGNYVCISCGGPGTATCKAPGATKIRVTTGSYYRVADGYEVTRYFFCNSGGWFIGGYLQPEFINYTGTNPDRQNGGCMTTRPVGTSSGSCSATFPACTGNISHCNAGYYKSGTYCYPCEAPGTSTSQNNEGQESCYVIGNHSDDTGSYTMNPRCNYSI